MASGILKGAVDLDSIFNPYAGGTKPAVTNIVAGTEDLRDRYAPLSTGTAAAATGIKIAGGADINTLFAAIGTVELPFNGHIFLQSRESPATSALTMLMASDGTYTVSKNVGVPNPLETGTWDTLPGVPGDYEVLYTPTLVSGTAATVTNGAATYQPLSANRSFTVSISGSDITSYYDLNVKVRRIADAVVMFDSTCELDLEILTG